MHSLPFILWIIYIDVLVPMELESEDEDKDNLEGDKDELERSHIMEELWLEGVQLPPEPTGQCSVELQVRILIF